MKRCAHCKRPIIGRGFWHPETQKEYCSAACMEADVDRAGTEAGHSLIPSLAPEEP